METNKIIQGDCIEVLKTFPDNYFDSVITDPPYCLSTIKRGGETNWDRENYKKDELDNGGSVFTRQIKGFMGKEWDNDIAFRVGLWKEVFRVLKHGGFLLSFGGTRTYHRMACAIEDVGFEIRDMIEWVYGSGFPKSLNIGKAVDKLQGNKREIIGFSNSLIGRNKCNNETFGQSIENKKNNPYKKSGYPIEKGKTEWEGWGTALKPAHEPIVMARKPLSEKTVAENVLKYGTGGINIDGCRVGIEIQKPSTMPDLRDVGAKSKEAIEIYKLSFGQVENAKRKEYVPQVAGRFPANLIHDGSDEVLEIFPETNPSRRTLMGTGGDDKGNKIYGHYKDIQSIMGHNDSGSASRFFYCAKASKGERNYGCDEIEPKMQFITTEGNQTYKNIIARGRNPENQNKPRHNNHPTVKPIALMEYLIKLVTRKNGLVLDCFMGSGTTAVACLRLGYNFIGIEKEPEYIKIANARLKPYLNQKKLI